MTFDQLVQAMAVRLSITEDDVRECVNTFLLAISDEMQKGNDISLPQFGDFCVITCYDADAKQHEWKESHVRGIIFSAATELQEKINRW